jgi:hypothetical protein
MMLENSGILVLILISLVHVLTCVWFYIGTHVSDGWWNVHNHHYVTELAMHSMLAQDGDQSLHTADAHGDHGTDDPTAMPMDMDALNGTAMNMDALNGTAMDMDALNGTAMDMDALNGTAMDMDALNGTAMEEERCPLQVRANIAVLTCSSPPPRSRRGWNATEAVGGSSPSS